MAEANSCAMTVLSVFVAFTASTIASTVKSGPTVSACVSGSRAGSGLDTRRGVLQPLEGCPGGADEYVPERGSGRLIRVIGDGTQFGARGQEVAVDEFVVPVGNDRIGRLD